VHVSKSVARGWSGNRNSGREGEPNSSEMHIGEEMKVRGIQEVMSKPEHLKSLVWC
jgi:hypothetical protein